MKKARKKAIWVLILFLLVLAGSIYVALFGVGDRGKAKYISLGLDLLASGVRFGVCVKWIWS